MAGISQTNASNSADADGITTVFNFTFFVYSVDHVKVYSVLNDVLTPITTGFTTAINSSFIGGTVTFSTAPADALGSILVRREVPYTQTTEFADITRYKETAIEEALNTLAMQIQQIKAAVDRSIKYTETAGVADNTIGSPTDSYLLSCDGTTGRILPVAPSSLSLSGLDTLIGGLLADDFLKYNGSVWENTTPAEVRTALNLGTAAFEDVAFFDLAGEADAALAATLTFPCNGRLTLTTATPVTVADVTAATTVYFTPYKGNRIATYSGTAWQIFTLSEKSVAVPAVANKIYDVFLVHSTLALELVAWTDDTTRATALAYQDGVLVKTGDATRRYLGSFRTTSAAGQTEDSLTTRYVANYYNRVRKPMARYDSTGSWNYTLAAWQQANASALNQLNFLVPVNEEEVRASVAVNASNAGGTNVDAYAAIGLDALTPHASCSFVGSQLVTGQPPGVPLLGFFCANVPAGAHYLSWIEISKASGTTTWYGAGGPTASNKAGIIGSISC